MSESPQDRPDEADEETQEKPGESDRTPWAASRRRRPTPKTARSNRSRTRSRVASGRRACPRLKPRSAPRLRASASRLRSGCGGTARIPCQTAPARSSSLAGPAAFACKRGQERRPKRASRAARVKHRLKTQPVSSRAVKTRRRHRRAATC